MPFCEQCGTRLAEGTRACGSCGRGEHEVPPPPPPGYAPHPRPTGGLGSRPPAGAVASPAIGPRVVPGNQVFPAPAPAVRHGFPGVVIPPIAAAVTLIVTIAYATVYVLVKSGSVESVPVFLTGVAPAVLESVPFVGGSFGDWFGVGPLSGVPVVAIPFVAILATTALLASRTNTGVGGRLAIGGTVFVPLAVFTALLVLLNSGLGDYGYGLQGIDVVLLVRSAVDAAIVGLAGGLLGALISLAIKPPAARPVQPWG